MICEIRHGSSGEGAARHLGMWAEVRRRRLDSVCVVEIVPWLIHLQV